MKTMILEHPRIPSKKRFNDIANTPLWSCLMGGYAAASIEQAGFDTLFIDHAVKGMSFETTRKAIHTIDPDLLCVNAVYFWEHTPKLFEFFDKLKQQGFSGHINLFGFFPSLVYRQILSTCDVIDSIAVGEFEHTLPELALALKKGSGIEQIQGLALSSCLSDNKIITRPPEKNPDIFPFPKRSSLNGTVTLLGSRGCYNQCSFCPVPSFYSQGSLWKGRSPKNIVKEMHELIDQGVSQFYFSDPNFIGPGKAGQKRIMNLMDLIQPMGITFGMETRPQDLTDTVLEKLTQAGCTSLLMGIESGSKSVLESINKNSAANVGEKAILLCRKHGIEPEIGFLMFVPDSSLDGLAQNMDFLIKNKLLDYLARTANLLCHSQIVLGGTSGHAWFEKQNRLIQNGTFGFDAEISFLDPGVEWMSKLVIFACHTVLKSMSEKKSPVFWKKETTAISQALNKFLIDLFFRLLSLAEKQSDKKDMSQMTQSILGKIDKILMCNNH